MKHIYKSKKTSKRSRAKIFWVIFLLIFVVAGIVILIAHIPDISKNEQKVFKPSKVRIGFAMGTLKEERWFKDRDILIAKAHEKGYEVEWVNANENDVEQINQVKYLLSKNINILIIVPNNYENVAVQ